MKKGEKGFSLLEVALILLIMGIVGIAAMPSLQNIRRQEVNKLAREICLDLVTQRTTQYTNPTATYILDLVNKDSLGAEPYYGYQITKSGDTNPQISNLTHNRNIEITIVDAAALNTESVMAGTSFTDASKTIPTISKEQLNGLIDAMSHLNQLKFGSGKLEGPTGSYYDALGIRVKNDSYQVFIVFNFITGNYYTYTI